MAMATVAAVQCCRCLRYGHSNTQCDRPYFRVHTDAELRQQRLAEKEKRQQEWEARQAEKAKKQAEWDAKQAARVARQEARTYGKKASSEHSADTLSTRAETLNVTIDQDEVVRLASQDKDVRKLEKVLRHIERLEGQGDLDKLQLAKVAKKAEVVIQLDSARGLAASRVRDDLRKTHAASL
eukprot:TRINITY_DN3765_c0_g1_i10.p2 TRINITY_DN3765_c0_g1~~TRINITY_DN3765_c0_g1_i10.p2  ORF type:complete len:182 (-),score=54.41 TRINITY_DN3765_c0_g1_i10:5-550(-)